MEDTRGETNLRTFNTAKVFAEGILFPLMLTFKKYQRQFNYGCDDINSSIEITQEVREIQRFNGLKGMVETCYDLLEAISSTVKLKKNIEENKQLDELIKLMEKIKLVFYDQKDRFFITKYSEGGTVETLNRDFCNKIRKVIDTCYINTEILMTRNKLLFADANDEYASDAEIKEQIIKDYVDG